MSDDDTVKKHAEWPATDAEPARRDLPREVTTVEELQSLDEVSIVRGYWAGYANKADYSERDKGYWHGYLNGLVDGRHVSNPSAAQAELARVYVQSGELKADVARWKRVGIGTKAKVKP